MAAKKKTGSIKKHWLELEKKNMSLSGYRV